MAEEKQVLTVAAPPGARFKGYEGLRRSGPPTEIDGQIGPELKRFVLLQHHQGQVTAERITEGRLEKLRLRSRVGRMG